MECESLPIAERIQTLAAKVLATHPAGNQLCLIGGFRYRLLNASGRASVDIDYHWDGDLDSKQAEIVVAIRRRLLPEVERQFGYQGDVRPATGPDAESPVVRVILMAFYRTDESGSRIEIPLEITTIPRLDPPVVRTVAGTVFLTVSDADMIESKIIASLVRDFVRVRDLLDIFLFQDSLRADAAERLWQKFGTLSLSPADVVERLGRLQVSRLVHVRELDRLLDEQVDPTVAAHLRAGGGAAMIWDAVVGRLTHTLTVGGASS